jgi:hypothetical protein
MSMSLSRPFDSAGLRLELPVRPLLSFNPDIFQMDIRKLRGGESFRLWKGHESNSVRVTDTDKGRRQLVLLVQEPPRFFEEQVAKRGRAAPPPQFQGLRILKETESHWVVERRTASALRRYLCGMDECHLFIAEFAGGTTVSDAHRLLKPEAVRDADRSAPGRTLRQGEWFLVAPSAVERRLVELRLSESPYLVHRRESLGGNGRPHIADEVLRLAPDRVYARGALRHPDHKTLILDGWRRVHRNAEVHGSAAGANGIFWID